MADDLSASDTPDTKDGMAPEFQDEHSNIKAEGRPNQWRAIFSARVAIPALAMLVLCLVVYYPLHAAGFIWDDGYWILNNPTMHHWRDLGIIWFNPMTFMQYYPLSVTAYFLQYQLWGANAGPVDLIGTAFARSSNIPSVPASARYRPAQAAAARRDSYLRNC